MGIGIHGETQEEIQRIEIQADPTYEPDDEAAAGGEAAAAAAVGGEAAAACGEEANPTKKKTRKTTSDVWKHFTRGPVQPNGSYYGICNYCGEKYLQGQQRGTSSMRNHIDKKCNKIPRNKPEALQKLLQAKSGKKNALVAWRFDQMKCRKSLAKMVIAREYPFSCVNHHFFRKFLCELQPSFKIPSRTTLRTDCMKIYEEEQVNLYEMFGQRVFCLVLDNASSNDACISELMYSTPMKDDLPVEDKCSIQEAIVGCSNKMELHLFDVGAGLGTQTSNYERMASNEYTFIVNMGTQMHAKFNKYWSMGNSLLAIACVLDPRYKLDVVQYYMEEMCPDECENFISNIRECMSELYNEYVKAKAEEQGASDLNEPGMSKRHKSDVGASSMTSDRKAGLKDYLKGRKGTTGPKTELEEYLSSDRDDASLDDDFDILGWWKMKEPRFPVLAQLTRDILAVPISTVASESAFSISGRVLSQVKSSLSDESIEALLCAQDWLRVSIAETGKIIPAPLWTIEEEDINEEGQ
ncbi:hypothetical protein LUZ63_005075 [Rhynchospora breviuscula]|uniref:BED-type domain-containing protein n=1 Tax=Rhynchospora breviuscula TaxID=2022672 RepID=A0A9Q0CM65_9POAL|nr:hypothetical protein LUZ63_005075 [Rhynchospora breviuscula]